MPDTPTRAVRRGAKAPTDTPPLADPFDVVYPGSSPGADLDIPVLPSVPTLPFETSVVDVAPAVPVPPVADEPPIPELPSIPAFPGIDSSPGTDSGSTFGSEDRFGSGLDAPAGRATVPYDVTASRSGSGPEPRSTGATGLFDDPVPYELPTTREPLPVREPAPVREPVREPAPAREPSPRLEPRSRPEPVRNPESDYELSYGREQFDPSKGTARRRSRTRSRRPRSGRESGMPGWVGVGVSVICTAAAIALDLALTGGIGVFFGLCFVLTGFGVAAGIRRSQVFTAGVLPPLSALGAFVVLGAVAPDRFGADSIPQAILGGLAESAWFLVAASAVALGTVALRVALHPAAPGQQPD